MKKINELRIKIKRFLKKSGYPEFLHRFGPKTYNLIDHLIGFLIMESYQLSLRRASQTSNFFGQRCPTYSALCKSRKKIPLELFQKLLKITAGLSSGKVAIDGTGFSKSNPSFHYLKRIQGENPKRYTKLSALLDVKTKKFLVMRIRINPRHDMQDVKYLLKRVSDVKRFYGDRGYDSDEVHEQGYWSGIQTYIPPRRNIRLRKFRKFQMKNWDKSRYNLRSNVKSGFSAIKRKYGSSVRARKVEGQKIEIMCRGIAHNLNLTLM